ncbi:unnamed protein product [Ixodes pacificus]
MASKALNLLALLLAISGCLAHPTGAPEEACADMLPQHGDSLFEDASKGPYRLTQNKVDFKGGDVVVVTLSTSGTPFKGFLVKAFDENEKEVGQFEKTAISQPLTKCSASTHVEGGDKTTAALKWKAPAGVAGKVHFRATIVENAKKYFTNLKSTHA